MIDTLSRQTVAGQDVLRLAGLAPSSLEARLLRRGIRPESVRETRAVLGHNGVPFSAEAMVEETFVAKAEYPTPFPIGRYGNGQWPVYYAALAEETCAAEVAHHLAGQTLEGRYYAVVLCRFEGEVLNLVGQQSSYPDLVSPTDAGYPFCQRIAEEARSVASALYAPSARHVDAICVPAFTRQSLSQPVVVRHGRFIRDESDRLRFVS